MNQRGFATLEVILMVVVIGILASLAIPRFTDVTTRANTAKIMSDLSTINNAIALYYMDGGNFTSGGDVDANSPLKDYIEGVSPPTGSAFVAGEATEISGKNYKIKAEGNTAYAVLTMNGDDKKLEDFSIAKKLNENPSNN